MLKALDSTQQAPDPCLTASNTTPSPGDIRAAPFSPSLFTDPTSSPFLHRRIGLADQPHPSFSAQASFAQGCDIISEALQQDSGAILVHCFGGAFPFGRISGAWLWGVGGSGTLLRGTACQHSHFQSRYLTCSPSYPRALHLLLPTRCLLRSQTPNWPRHHRITESGEGCLSPSC